MVRSVALALLATAVAAFAPAQGASKARPDKQQPSADSQDPRSQLQQELAELRAELRELRAALNQARGEPQNADKAPLVIGADRQGLKQRVKDGVAKAKAKANAKANDDAGAVRTFVVGGKDGPMTWKVDGDVLHQVEVDDLDGDHVFEFKVDGDAVGRTIQIAPGTFQVQIGADEDGNDAPMVYVVNEDGALQTVRGTKAAKKQGKAKSKTKAVDKAPKAGKKASSGCSCNCPCCANDDDAEDEDDDDGERQDRRIVFDPQFRFGPQGIVHRAPVNTTPAFTRFVTGDHNCAPARSGLFRTLVAPRLQRVELQRAQNPDGDRARQPMRIQLPKRTKQVPDADKKRLISV